MSESKKNTCLKRAFSLLGPSPTNKFGPKATSVLDTDDDQAVQSSGKILKWSNAPESVLIIKKFDVDLVEPFIKCATWLLKDQGLKVFVEKAVLSEDVVINHEKFKTISKDLSTFTGCSCIDLIVCLGGDGTLLYAASLFQHSMPPVVPFHMGSLGFMTSHIFSNFEETLKNVFNGKASMMLRSRLRCILTKGTDESESGASVPMGHISPCSSTDSSLDLDTCASKSYLVLNEVSVHRGISSHLCNVDLFLEDRWITSVQGDGLVISTPTGSTGYAVAAGASVVHPQVPSIMITPICPHSLSFRPVIVPAGANLKLKVSENARSSALLSFDGKGTVELEKGDVLLVRTSTHPTPCVCKSNPFDDWFDSLSECLLWNSRLQQKKLNTPK